MTASDAQPAPRRESLQGLIGGQRTAIESLPMLRVALQRVGSSCADEFLNLATIPLRLVLQSIESSVTGNVLAAGRGSSAVAILEAPGWNARLFVSAPRHSVFAIVEMLLGGDGSHPPHTAERPLSKIEVGVAGIFFGSIARALAEAFGPIAASPFSVASTSDQVSDLEFVGPQDPVVVAKYGLQALAGVGEVIIAIPHVALEALHKPLSRLPAKNASRPDPGWTKQIKEELTRASVTLTAILDERPGLLAEMTNLRVGEVLELKATPQSRVRVECNGEPLMWCELGKSSGVYTVRVEDFVDREQEFFNDIRAA